MNDKASEKENLTNGTADNMSQNGDAMEEALANELNVDDSVSGMQHLDDEITNEDDLERLQKELDEAKDKYMRLVAEFDNFRKRNAKERIELIATAGRDIVQSLLVVLDDSERAEKQMESTEDVKAIKEGVLLVFNKMRNALQQKGLKAMDSSKSVDFYEQNGFEKRGTHLLDFEAMKPEYRGMYVMQRSLEEI